ncbi:hypothetical protein BH09BAC1_BH09BAC1_02350 [soil metagenome]
MKKIFTIGALVLGTVVFAQAQTATPQGSPKKDGQVKEAPTPAVTPSTGRTATGVKPGPSTSIPASTDRSTQTPSTTRPVSGEPVNVGPSTTPVQTQPVKKVQTDTPPKN